MSFRPIDQIPSVTRNGITRDDYDAVRAEVRLHPQQEGCIADGMQVADAKKLRTALVKTPGDHYFATVRSGHNLPAGFKGPAAVFGGYALTEDQKARARGKS